MMRLFSVIIYNLWGNCLQSKKKWIVMITQIKQNNQLFVWLFSLCALNNKGHGLCCTGDFPVQQMTLPSLGIIETTRCSANNHHQQE